MPFDDENPAGEAGNAAAAGASKVGHGLTRRVGPAPLWGWLVAGGGALVLTLYLKRRAAAGGGTTATTAADAGSAPSGGGGAGDAGGAGSVGPGASTPAPATGQDGSTVGGPQLPGTVTVTQPGPGVPAPSVPAAAASGPVPGNAAAPGQHVDTPRVDYGGGWNPANGPATQHQTEVIAAQPGNPFAGFAAIAEAQHTTLGNFGAP